MVKFFSLLVLTLISLAGTWSAWGTDAVPLNVQTARQIISDAGTSRPPVILVPGLEGSQLEARLDKPTTVNWLCARKGDWFNIWLDVKEFFPEVVDCFLDNMSMKYNRTAGRTMTSAGVVIRPKAFGKLDGIEYLTDQMHLDAVSYYAHIIDLLVTAGYTKNLNILGAPYDWRRSPDDNDEFLGQMQSLVETAYEQNGKTKSIIVCHSMGCLYSLYFLNQMPKEWKAKHVQQFIALAAPWGGAVPAVRAIVSGSNLKMFIYKDSKLRGMERSMSSSYYLLPVTQVFEKTPFLSLDGRDFSTADYVLLFDKLNLTNGKQMYSNSKDLTSGLEHPGVDVLCAHGEGVDTIEKLNFKSVADFPDNPELIQGQGDGTVNRVSLEACLKWGQSNEFNFQHKTFSGLKHIDTVRSSDVAEMVLSTVANWIQNK
jgi:lysophospholipase-3